MLKYVVVAVCLWSTTARADTAEGERLFQDGRKLFESGALAEACDAFDASYRADANLSTLMNLANCRERNGQLASAWLSYVSVSNQTAKLADRARMHERALERATALQSRISYLYINVPSSLQVSGLVVTRNGKVVDRSLWNRRLPTDGGSYVIATQSPRHLPWSTTVLVEREGGQATVEIPQIEALPSVDALDSNEGAKPQTRQVESYRQPLAFGLAGAGVITTIGAFTVAPKPIALLGVGAIAAGVVLYLLDREDRRAAALHVAPAPSGAGVVFGGSF